MVKFRETRYPRDNYKNKEDKFCFQRYFANGNKCLASRTVANQEANKFLKTKKTLSIYGYQKGLACRVYIHLLQETFSKEI